MVESEDQIMKRGETPEKSLSERKIYENRLKFLKLLEAKYPGLGEEPIFENKDTASDESDGGTSSEVLPQQLETDKLKYDSYDKDSNTITLEIYIKNIKDESLKVSFGESFINIVFQTSTPGLISPEFTDPGTVYTWNLNLKNEIVPEECSYKTTAFKLEINLKKKKPCKWETIKESKPKMLKEAHREINLGDIPATPTNIWIPATPIQPMEGDKCFKDLLVALSTVPPDTIEDWYEKKAAIGPVENPTVSTKVPPRKITTAADIGYTGLENLGNTCFMNAVLQCLSNTQELRDYFMENHFKEDLNEKNALGTGGQLAVSFAVLMKHLWSGAHPSYSPSKLKSLLSDKLSQFSGFAQHDAQEYMAFLLDALHEDINRIRQKPYVEMSSKNGDDDQSIPDEELADDSWRKYRMRNDSVIVDLFHGQYKSRVACPVCPKVSITFDPFLLLPVPMPKNQILHSVFFFPRDTSKKPIRYLVKLPQDSKMRSLMQSISSRVSVPVNNLRAIFACNGMIQSILKPDSSIPPITNNELLLIFESLNSQDLEEQVYEFAIHQRLSIPHQPARCSSCNKIAGDNVKLKRCTKCYRSCYCDQECQKNNWSQHKDYCTYRPEPVGCPFIISIPQSQCTFSNLTQLASDYSRHSVDVYCPNSRSDSINDCPEVKDNDSGIYSDTPENSCSSSSSGASTSSAPLNLSTKSRFYLRHHPNHLDTTATDENLIREPEDEDGDTTMLDLNSKYYLSMEWKNDKQDGSVIVESKDLDHNYDILEAQKISNENTEHTLEECLRLFIEPEVLSQREAWYCPSCKEHREAVKQLTLWRLPPILVIQLKRFLFKNMYYKEKIDKFIKFPLENLDMSDFCCPNAHKVGQQKPIYNLYAVINHHGGMLGGHYTAFARTRFKNRTYGWRVFDDARVKDISEEDVVTENAYILFYRLKDEKDCQ